MFAIISLIILTLAVSIDGFGVGMMYGMKNIRIPVLSIIIISLCTGIVIMASMYIGVLLLQFIPPYFAKLFGALILIGIGIGAIIQLKMKRSDDAEAVKPERITTERKKEYRFEIKSIGLVIHIWRTPSKADIDRSGNISAFEATLLGLALSLDAFGAGIGAALIGFSPILTSIFIAISGGVFITLGLQLGYVISGLRWVENIAKLPGFILILIGILKLF